MIVTINSESYVKTGKGISSVGMPFLFFRKEIMTASLPLLFMDHCTKVYPGVRAIDDVSFEVKKGETHALIGENGAGKSTLIKCLSGAVQLDSGKITFEGIEYKKMSPYLSREIGIEIIYQELNLIPALTVAENICFGDSNSFWVDYKANMKTAQDVLDRMNVKLDLRKQVQKLSIAQQQIVEIAKAISKNTKLIVMDEPTAPLTEKETETLFEIIDNLKKQGISIIFISHRLDEIFSICDRVTVMRDGKVIDTRDVKDINRDTLISLMVGRSLCDIFPKRSHITDIPEIELRSITGSGDKDISLKVNKGEIVGIAGLVGSGRTELLRMIYGADPIASGQILLEGKVARISNTGDAIRNGIGLIPEDRKTQGCFLYSGIDWNITISAIRFLSNKGIMNFRKMQEVVKMYIQKLQIKTPRADQTVMNLSGGNQQKVVVAKTMAANCKVLLFDEPTRGIDVAAKQEIYQLMTKFVDEGNAILMVTSDMEELLGMSDRIYVLAEGRLTGEVSGTEATQEKLMHLMSKGG